MEKFNALTQLLDDRINVVTDILMAWEMDTKMGHELRQTNLDYYRTVLHTLERVKDDIKIVRKS